MSGVVQCAPFHLAYFNIYHSIQSTYNNKVSTNFSQQILVTNNFLYKNEQTIYFRIIWHMSQPKKINSLMARTKINVFAPNLIFIYVYRGEPHKKIFIVRGA